MATMENPMAWFCTRRFGFPVWLTMGSTALCTKKDTGRMEANLAHSFFSITTHVASSATEAQPCCETTGAMCTIFSMGLTLL